MWKITEHKYSRQHQELFRKHFGEKSASVDLNHPNMEKFFDELNQECINEDKKKNCSHEFVYREYFSQPYGTCLECGKTVFFVACH